AERHVRMGDVAFLLEPDLKEGRGGLRDVHALRVAALAVPVVPEDDLIEQAAETLMAARVELHRSTGKSSDRLTLQEQEQVARALDFPTPDALMQRVSAAGRTVGWSANDGPWAAATPDALISLLSAGPGAVHAFEALDQYDLLVRILPEWEPVRSRLQHNPYHRYTVDRHLLEAAAGAAALTGRVSRPD